MTEYTLHFQTREGERTISYEADSMGAALDIAKERAQGNAADLMVDGKLVCKMQMIEDTGVWRINPKKL